MDAIYNDSILNELKEATERKGLCEKELLNIAIKIKQKVYETVNDDINPFSGYRYIVHLKAELMYRKKGSLKKK